MNLITVLSIMFIIFLLITLCGWCCKASASEQAGTTFTTVVAVPQPMVQNTSVCQPPYPTQMNMMPQPVMMGGAPPVGQIGFTPYPPAHYQPPQPGFIGSPYPPHVDGTSQLNPPSYAEATGTPGFGTQPASNPNYR